MSRRDRIDPETARLVEQRLQWLLQENGPVPALARTPASTAAPTRLLSESALVGSGSESAPVGSRSKSEVVEPSAESATRSSPTRSRPPALEAPAPIGERRPRLPRPSVSAPGLLLAAASFRRPHLLVVAVILTLGILVAGWAVLRARPVALAVTPPPAVGPTPAVVSGAPGRAPTPSASATVAGVVVHVLGAVRRPGLVSLQSGGRVQDAIDAAGGLTAKADPGELNLAQAVTDGQQIVVGTKTKPAGEVRDGSASGGAGGSAGSGAGGGGAGQPVNLNTASLAQLEELPGVGPVMAGKIVAWRTENGRFSRIEELQEIDGVGPKTYAKLAPLCRV